MHPARSRIFLLDRAVHPFNSVSHNSFSPFSLENKCFRHGDSIENRTPERLIRPSFKRATDLIHETTNRVSRGLMRNSHTILDNLCLPPYSTFLPHIAHHAPSPSCSKPHHSTSSPSQNLPISFPPCKSYNPQKHPKLPFPLTVQSLG